MSPVSGHFQKRRAGARKLAVAISLERLGSELIQKVRQLLIGRAAHLRQAADRARKCLERLVIDTALIGGEVVPDMHGRAVAAVAALEIIEIGREHLLAISVLMIWRVAGARLRHAEIEVHRQGRTPRPPDTQRRQIEAPQSTDLLGPRLGGTDAARVIAEAARLERAVKAGASRQIGRAEARHPLRSKHQPRRIGQAVVSCDLVDRVAEGGKLLFPFRRRPDGAVEMPDRMGSDLVAVAMQRIHELDPPRHVVAGPAEIDRRVAAPLPRSLIDHAARIADQIGTADEEREMDARAVAVHVGREIGEIAPALDLAAIVERHHDELRRALGGGVNGRCDEKRRDTRKLPPHGSIAPHCEVESALRLEISGKPAASARRHISTSPSTSAMEYRPGFWSRAHSAALSAPRAKIMRSSALCDNSSRSAVPAKITV